MSDSFRRMLEQEDAFRRAIDPYGASRRRLDAVHPALAVTAGRDSYLTPPTVSSQLLDAASLTAKAQNDLEKAMAFDAKLSSITQAVELAAKAQSAFDANLTSITSRSASENFLQAIDRAANAQRDIELAAGFDARLASFRYPDRYEIGSLARQAMLANSLTSRIFPTVPELQLRMEAMNHAWVGSDAVSSALGFAAMQSMGSALDRLEPFERSLATALRTNLGDWRDVIAPTLPTILDAQLRSDLYLERGFNPALTRFSEGAFVDSAELAGLISRRSTERDADEEIDDFEIGLQRNKEAFDRIQRFEIAIRQFIDSAMRSHFGEKWMKQQIPATMHERWCDKREKAIKAGEQERPLIEYADFSDYRIIIERNDNWNGAFKHIFGRLEDVRESLQRLQPVRIATMHARWITLDDEALLIFEIKRLMKAILRYLG